MALVKTLELKSGIQVQDAYHKVTVIRLDMVARECSLGVQVFASKAARLAGKPPITSLGFNAVVEPPIPPATDAVDNFERFFSTIRLSTMNPTAAAYLFLKSLPEYFNFIDDL